MARVAACVEEELEGPRSGAMVAEGSVVSSTMVLGGGVEGGVCLKGAWVKDVRGIASGWRGVSSRVIGSFGSRSADAAATTAAAAAAAFPESGHNDPSSRDTCGTVRCAESKREII